MRDALHEIRQLHAFKLMLNCFSLVRVGRVASEDVQMVYGRDLQEAEARRGRFASDISLFYVT